MDVNVKVKKNLQFRAFYLVFIFVAIQIGVGLMGSPRLVYLEVKQDSWISILIAFAYMIAVLLVMLYILKQYENADIYGIQVDIFGKWIGKLLGTIYIIHFALALFSVLITYVEVVRVFMFPSLSTFWMSFLLLSLVIYSILGGIRVIVGLCTLVFIFMHWLITLLIQPALAMDITHFQPFFAAPFPDLLKGAKTMSYTFIGFEILFIIYPFIRNKEKAKLSTLVGVGLSTFHILLSTILVIGYFSYVEIERREWVLLGLYKIQSFAFIERFDYIVVASWMLIILPNLMLLMWAITYGMKRMYKIPQRKTLYIVSILLLIASPFFDEHYRIQQVIDVTAKYGAWIVYVYPFVLLPLVFIKKRRKKQGK